MIKTKTNPGAWRKTAKSRLRFELAGLAFARQKGFSSEDYARYLWSSGAVGWMGKARPDTREYLRKEAEAFQRFYPEVSFELVEAGDERAELVFTGGCLGGWGKDRWALARQLHLAKEDVCAYCQEAFRVWAEQLGLSTQIGPKDDTTCRLLVLKH
ncbi:MAG: hypothetical protein HYY80_02500 [Chloroflexi bacterium]|nr:hypothetical protein [Chloroflexota bacterium]MBI3930687.1 hypothetical protein [Chloroflexota bacterium]